MQLCVKKSVSNWVKSHIFKGICAFFHWHDLMERQWFWNTGQNTQMPSNSNICILAKWADSSHAGQAHLRQNELPVEFSHKHFEEVQELLFANLISQKLQEEVALREKRKSKPTQPEYSRCPTGLYALSFQTYLQIVHLHEGFFWVEGMFHYRCTRLAHFPSVLFIGPVCKYTNICKHTNTTWIRLWSDKAKCCIYSALLRNTLTSAYIKIS